MRILTIFESSKHKAKGKDVEDRVCCLKWDFHSPFSGTLLVIQESGLARNIQFAATDEDMNHWQHTTLTKTLVKTSLTHVQHSFVVSAAGLSSVLTSLSVDDTNTKKPAATSPATAGHEQYWVIASSKEVRCFSGVGGEKLSKADWNGEIQDCSIVERNGA